MPGAGAGAGDSLPTLVPYVVSESYISCSAPLQFQLPSRALCNTRAPTSLLLVLALAVVDAETDRLFVSTDLRDMAGRMGIAEMIRPVSWLPGAGESGMRVCSDASFRFSVWYEDCRGGVRTIVSLRLIVSELRTYCACALGGDE